MGNSLKAKNVKGKPYIVTEEKVYRTGLKRLIAHRNDNGQTGYFKFTKPNGTIFEGDYKDGLPNGYCAKTFSDGRRFEGEFIDGKANGHGIMHYEEDCSRFEGAYMNNQRNGYGVHTFEDGRRFEAEYLHGQVQGAGVMVYPDGQIVVGTFDEMELKTHSMVQC